MTDVKGFFDNNTGRWYDVFLRRAMNGKQFLLARADGATRLANVDFSKLDMQSTWNCVAAQFCGNGYSHATQELGLGTDYDRQRDLGFVVGSDVMREVIRETGWDEYTVNNWAYGQLTLAWLEVLTK